MATSNINHAREALKKLLCSSSFKYVWLVRVKRTHSMADQIEREAYYEMMESEIEFVLKGGECPNVLVSKYHFCSKIFSRFKR